MQLLWPIASQEPCRFQQREWQGHSCLSGAVLGGRWHSFPGGKGVGRGRTGCQACAQGLGEGLQGSSVSVTPSWGIRLAATEQRMSPRESPWAFQGARERSLNRFLSHCACLVLGSAGFHLLQEQLPGERNMVARRGFGGQNGLWGPCGPTRAVMSVQPFTLLPDRRSSACVLPASVCGVCH